MWRNTDFNQNNNWLNTAINSQFKTVTNAVVVPVNLASENSTAGDALTDSARRDDFVLLQNNLEALAITPWHQGAFNGSKQDANFWLSPGDAQNSLADQLEFIGWDSCLVLMVMADKAENLATKIESLMVVFPHVELAKAFRHAKALASHEAKKLFVPGIKQDDRKTATIEKLGAFSALLHAKQNLAISEAVASDQDTQTLLTDFKAKRLARLDEIKSQVESLTDQNGPIENVLHLTGGNLDAQLRAISPPSENAPLCCLLALGGSANDLAPLLEVLGL